MNPDIRYVNAANDLRREYAAGLRPVPRSAYHQLSPLHTYTFYQLVINDVITMMNKLGASQDEATTLLENAAASLNTLMEVFSDATKSQQDAVAPLLHAATHLSDAAMKLHSKDMTEKLMGASVSLRYGRLVGDLERMLTETAGALNAVAEMTPDPEIVFVYDVEEIAMLSRNYVAEFLTRFPDIFLTLVYQLVERVLTRSGFSRPDELNDGNVVNIDSIDTEDPFDNETHIMRRVLPKYNKLRQLYNEISSGFQDDGPIVNYDLIRKCGLFGSRVELCQAAAQLQGVLNQRWQSVRQCLDIVNKRAAETQKKFANVVISKEGVGYGAAQLLVSGCAHKIPIENIFSTAKTSKAEVFELIQRKFGRKCVMVYVTSPQTSYIPRNPQIRVWPIEGADSLEALYNAQRDHFLR